MPTLQLNVNAAEIPLLKSLFIFNIPSFYEVDGLAFWTSRQGGWSADLDKAGLGNGIGGEKYLVL